MMMNLHVIVFFAATKEGEFFSVVVRLDLPLFALLWLAPCTPPPPVILFLSLCFSLRCAAPASLRFLFFLPSAVVTFSSPWRVEIFQFLIFKSGFHGGQKKARALGGKRKTALYSRGKPPPSSRYGLFMLLGILFSGVINQISRYPPPTTRLLFSLS